MSYKKVCYNQKDMRLTKSGNLQKVSQSINRPLFIETFKGPKKKVIILSKSNNIKAVHIQIYDSDNSDSIMWWN